MFFQFLHDCWAEDSDFQEKLDALQEAIATTMMGTAPLFQRVFCLKGMAKSGKSRLVEIVKGLMPEGSTAKIHPSDWGDKFAPSELFGKLMNEAGELHERRNIDAVMFKQIVVGEEINAQRKYGQLFDFRPKCAHWFASNHLPKTLDYTDGFNRRWLFFEFNTVVTEERKVLDLDKIILANEREQIAAWALQAIPRLLINKEYTLAPSHEAVIDEVANQNNSVRYFLAQCPTVMVGRDHHPDGKSENRTIETRLHDVYWRFCKFTALVPHVSQRAFNQMMKELQTTFGFAQTIKKTDRHGVQTVYEWITLVDEGGL